MFKRITITLLAMLMLAMTTVFAQSGKPDDPIPDPEPESTAELLPVGNTSDLRYLDGKLGIGTNSSIYRLFTADNSLGWSCRFFNEQGNANIWMCHGEKNGMQIRVDETTASNYLLQLNKDSETLFEVQGDGRVGIGTYNPGYRLHAIDNSPGWGYRFFNEQGNANIWMCHGEKNGMQIRVDETTASNYLLQLNKDSETLFEVQGDGRVGIGTYNPGYRLHAIDNSPGWGYRFDNLDGNATVYMCNGAGFGMHIQNDDATASTYLLHLNNSGNALFEVTGDGKVGIGTGAPGHKLHVIGDIYATGTVTTGSSRDLKNNIAQLSGDEAVKALMSLMPVKYNYKTNSEELELGFIAEDVPDLVARNDRKSLSPMDFAALSVSVCQEQQKLIRDQQMQMNQLLERIAALEAAAQKK